MSSGEIRLETPEGPEAIEAFWRGLHADSDIRPIDNVTPVKFKSILPKRPDIPTDDAEEEEQWLRSL